MWRGALLFLALAGNASAQLPGMDVLAGAKYCDDAIATHPQDWAFGVFLELDGFGDASNCIKKFCSSGKTKHGRIHLTWEDSHKCTDPKLVAKRAKKLEPTAAFCKSRGVTIFPSGQCEHNCDTKKAKLFRAKTKANCPSCGDYVNTPWRGALLTDDKFGTINETHGSSPKVPGTRWFTSFDGISAVDSDVEGWKRKVKSSEIAFFWEPRFNGRWESNDPTPRPKRKGWPDKKLLKSVSYLWTNPGDVGKFPGTWKSHSENHGAGDQRAEKPVAIIKDKVSKIELIAANGKTIAKADRYGSFSGGGYRFYLPRWGVELAEEARKASGSPLTFVKAGKKKYGPVNPAFRAGNFR